MRLDHHEQTTFAKKELERLGRPMPMDYNDDHLNLPILETPPSNYLYRELLSEASKTEAVRQGYAIHGAIVRKGDNEEGHEVRYYTQRGWARSK